MNRPAPVLGTFDIVVLVVGTVVGAGLYKTPAVVAGLVPDGGWITALWVLGGLISIIGALCYSELSTAFPDTAGECHFLRLAWSRDIAFLYAWSRSVVIVPGSIAMLAVTFGDYLSLTLPLGERSPYLWAALLAAALTLLNWFGLAEARFAQRLFFFAALGIALLIVLAGVIAHEDGPTAAASVAGTTARSATGPSGGGLGLAMVFVMLAYGGWNEAAYISAETRNPQRGIYRGLLFGLVAVIALYLGVNAALLSGLGREALAASDAPLAELFAKTVGPGSGVALSLIVAVSCMKSVNATMFFGARSSFILGRDWRAFRWLDGWHQNGVPRRALIAQLVVTLVLIGLAALTRDGFVALVEFTAPVFWSFTLLVALSLIVLRRRYPEAPRPFRVPLYPLLPSIFAAVCIWLLWSSIMYAGSGALIGIALLAAGLVPLAWERYAFRSLAA